MKAVITGSFDPITVGHLDIIKRASEMFDEVCVLICINSEKPGKFTPEIRKEMAALSTVELKNVTVDVCYGLMTEYTEKNGYQVIVRGIRDIGDISYEMMLATINRSLRNHPETVFIPSKPEHSHISSSYVRDMIKYKEDISGILPDAVINVLKNNGLI